MQIPAYTLLGAPPRGADGQKRKRISWVHAVLDLVRAKFESIFGSAESGNNKVL